MKYKIAHFADVHWRGLSRHAEYKRAFRDAFETMRAENVDAIIIVGDIVDIRKDKYEFYYNTSNGRG